LWIEALKKSALILYPVVTFFIFFGFDIMTTVYSDKYYNSGHYFKINIFLNYFNIIMFSPVFYGMGKVRLYSNLHLIFAVLAWVAGYILILIFNHPFAIAYLSTAIQVMFILVSVWLVKDLLKQKITDLIPFGFLLLVLGHTIFTAFLSERIIRLLDIQSDFFRLIGGGVIFISILLASDILLKLNYLNVILNPFKDLLKRKVIV
jgi:O-antigen/teichoic acid export membrane protein